jgi:RNA polymerase-binding protein DksA
MNVDTQLHLTTLRGLLSYQRDELSAELHALTLARERGLAELPTTEVTDLKEDAVAEQQSDLSDAAQERLRQELARCEAALRRLDEERYGDCCDCGEAIPWPRLLAQPAAERCVDCQRTFERASQLPLRT